MRRMPEPDAVHPPLQLGYAAPTRRLRIGLVPVSPLSKASLAVSVALVPTLGFFAVHCGTLPAVAWVTSLGLTVGLPIAAAAHIDASRGRYRGIGMAIASLVIALVWCALVMFITTAFRNLPTC